MSDSTVRTAARRAALPSREHPPERVALAVEGTRGDVYPMLALGERLRARGHDVVVCAPPDFRGDAEARGFAFHPVAQDVRAYLEAQAAALHAGPLAMLGEMRRFLVSNAEAQFRDLADALDDGTDLVLSAGTQLAASSVAQWLGVPHRFVAYFPAMFPCSEHPPATVPHQTLPGWLNRTAWWATVKVLDRMVRPTVNRERARLGLRPARDLYQIALSERPVLAADSELATAPAAGRVPVQQVRCLHPFEEAPLPDKLRDFLDAGEPPVYVGFGSMTDPDPARSTRLILEAVERAEVRAVISAGWAGLGGMPLPEEVRVVDAVCHASLFRRVCAVVHHGGAGTTTTAARAGVPQIVVPHVLDQYYWGRRVEVLGLGPPALRRERLTAEELALSLRSLRDNELVAERAADLGRELRARLAEEPDPAAALV